MKHTIIVWSAIVAIVVAFTYTGIRLHADAPQRFSRVGYSDLHDNLSSVSVIRDAETGQCRAYVQLMTRNMGTGYTGPIDVSAISDTWPVPCSRFDTTPAPLPPPASPIK